MLRLTLRLLAAVAVMAVLSSCQVDASVTVDLAADGTGLVTVEASLDAEASAVFFETGQGLITSDLVAAGWTIDGLQGSQDQLVTIVASKRVGSAQRLGEVLDEIAGVGVFSNVAVVPSSEFAEQRHELMFDVDLRRGWAIFNRDGANTVAVPAVREAVGSAAVDDVLTVVIEASIAAADDGPPSALTFAPRFGDAEPTEVRVVAIAEQANARLFRWIAYALGLLFLLSIALGIVGSRLERRADRLRKRAPSIAAPSRSSSTRDAVTPPAQAESETAPASSAPQIRLVVVEPLTVLYHQRDALDKYLVPFIRHNGGTAPVEVIGDALDQVRSGSIGTAEMWAWCGVDGDPEEIDSVFVTMRWLRDEATVLMRELAHRRLPIAALTNDAVAWSLAMRDRDQLHTVWPWLVSSEVGGSTTERAMFDTLQRQSGVTFENCVYVDTELAALDAAAQRGMQTIHFRPDGGEQSGESTHRVCTDLLHLLTPARRPL